jgi:hypothetical protein
MVTRTKLALVCYGVTAVVFFVSVAPWLLTEQKGYASMLCAWIASPGIYLAAFCLVGVHSDHFVLVSILANIAFYLLAPWLLWKIFRGKKKRGMLGSS